MRLSFGHLDDTYQTQTQDFHKISLQPAPGKHSLTAVDGEGNTVSTTFFSNKHLILLSLPHETAIKENGGLPASILWTLAIVAGVSVANIYYIQPLLNMIRHELGISEFRTNLIAMVTQIGYAAGLLFITPLEIYISVRKSSWSTSPF